MKEPDLDDVKKQLALSWYFYRLKKGLDVEIVPEKFFDSDTRLLYREIIKRHKAQQAPDIRDLFKMPFQFP